jgi:diguanylate cyclase (GGDEF)-like protein
MRGLPLRAQAYIVVMALGALAAAVWAASHAVTGGSEVALGLGLACAAALAQAFEVHMPSNKAYNATLAFLLAASLLVGPFPTVLVAATPFIVEQIRRPKQMYIQIFNVSTHVIAALAAAGVYAVFRGHWASQGGGISLVGAACALATLLAVNHTTLVVVLWWARGVRPRDSGLFGIEGLLTDATLLALGVVVAALYTANHSLVLFALVPFALLQRALYFPELTRASRTDPKTGLINSAYFAELAEEELRRAARFGHPVAVVVADLDLLRNINNAYGHLAGDIVLKGVADILKEEVREYDVVARFGGEEFALLLPNADIEEAHQVAERIRGRVARERYDVATSLTPIPATLSLGVSVRTVHGETLKELMHAADLAVYRAKMEGRDRVRLARTDEGADTAPGTFTKPVSPITRVLDPAVAAPVPEQRPAEPPVRRERPSLATTVRRRATWPLTGFAVIAACLAAPAAVWVSPGLSWAILVFPLLALAAELSGESVYGSSFVSLSAVPILAAAAAGQSAAAVLAAVVSGLAGSVSRHRRVEQVVFNTATFALSAAIASLVRGLLVSDHSAFHSGELPLLALVMELATIAYWLVDNGLVSLVVARDEGRSPWRVLKDDLAWLLPHYAVFGVMSTLLGAAWEAYALFGLATFLLPPVLVRVAQRQYLARTASNVAELRRLADDLRQSKSAVEDSNVALEHALTQVRERHFATARALAGAIDARDETTGGHIERVSALCQAMCEVVDSDLASDPQVLFGFLLHDVGKIGVPDAVLLKPAELDAAETEIMRRHPEIGAALLSEAGFTDAAKEIVLTHHERWDGSGYPRGLEGTEIPLCSRLFAVADALDAMTNDRPYRRGIPLEHAYEELRKYAGTQFDPLAVETLLTLPLETVQGLLRLGLVPPGDTPRSLTDLLR